MIVELNGRPLSEARAAAANFLQATRPDGALQPVGHRTSDEERLESARMRDKVKGTKKMRAAILDALERLQSPVLRAAKIREDDNQDDDADGLADAAGAAADAWPDDLLFDALDGITTELFDAAGKGAAAEVKASWNVVPKNAIAAIKKAHLAFSKQFIERERTALKSMLTNAVESGMSVGELRDEIANFFDDGIHYVDDAGKVTRVLPADSWAEQVARTEVSRAYNAGHMATYQAAGIQRVRWLTASDERVCDEICAPLERVAVAVGDTFPGTDVTEPPAHPNCIPAGARVLSGRGFVPIETIVVGDMVMTHQNRFRAVTALSQRDISEDLVELYVGPYNLRVTKEHPILTTNGWIDAFSLTVGDGIRALEQVAPVHIVTDRLASVALVPFSGTVYNFAVDEDESYIAEGIVSHNCRCTTVAVWESRTDDSDDDDDTDEDDEGDE